VSRQHCFENSLYFTNELDDVDPYRSSHSHTALLTLKEGFEGQMTEKTIEIGVIGIGAQVSGDGQGQTSPSGESSTGLTFRKLSEADVRDYLSL